MAKCVMFDFDGVVVDSESYGLELLRRLMKEQYSVDMTEEDSRHVIGFNKSRTVDFINSAYGLNTTVEEYDASYGKYDNFYVDYEGIKPIDGARECMEKLSSAGFTVGLVSSTQALYILSALNRIGMTDCFDFIVTGDMVENSKPSPEPYLKGLSLAGCNAGDAFVVEDSPTGVSAGKAAGIFTIGFKAASVKLPTPQADIEIPSYEELYDYIVLFK